MKRDATQNPDDKHDQIFRKVRGILNKLTPEKFDKLNLELLNVGLDSNVILKGVILLIFEKALDEPKYSSMYAQLCHQLCEDSPNFEPPSSKTTTFRRLLLNKCQDEFENRSKATELEAFDRKDGTFSAEEAEQYHIAKRKMLGNIKFIGELGKLEMLHEGILHRCIKQLLEKKKNVPVQDMVEDLECLCQIMRTVGRRLDTPKAKSWMDQYFQRIQIFAKNMEFPSRIRFMLRDVADLRRNNWVPRSSGVDNGPKTITQIRLEAADEYGEYIPPPQSRQFGNRSSMNGGMSTQWMASTPGQMGDLFGMSSPGMLMGTGPGVIHDGPGYPMNMGKPRNMQQGQGFNNFNKPRQDGGGRGNMRQNQNNQQMQGGRQSPQSLQQQQKQANQAPRDLPPRFARLAQQQQQQIAQQAASANGTAVMIPSTTEEISLRPAKNFTVFKPSTPNNLPKSAQVGPQNAMMKMSLGPPEPPKPLLNKQAQITIKQVTQEKPKPNKKVIPTKDEVMKSTMAMLEEYLANCETNEALNSFKDLNSPKKFHPDLLAQMMTKTVDKSDSERESVMKLISAMKADNLITSDQFMEGLQSLLEKMAELEPEVPLVKSYISKFAAMGVTEGVITIQELSVPMENGTYYPLFLLCLQQMHKLKDKNWLVSNFNDSKVSLQNMLPEIDQTKERMMEILEDRGLSFMFPLLRVQAELWKQVQAEPGATATFKWIKENVDTDLHHSAGFINILTACVLKYITMDTTLGKDVDSTVVPEKAATEKEKQRLDKLKGVLQLFLHEKMDLQVEALYAAQVFCHSHHFPKGMLLRMFMHFYDMEILEEESFLKWKEEVNDEHPGKGKALFQVNQWLTWLEQAEEETDDEED